MAKVQISDGDIVLFLPLFKLDNNLYGIGIFRAIDPH